MKLRLRAYTEPDHAVMGGLWSLVTARTTLEGFEAFVYDSIEALGTVFAEETVSVLVELNYRTVRTTALRRDIRDAVENLPLGCECCKIPPAVAMDIGFP